LIEQAKAEQAERARVAAEEAAAAAAVKATAEAAAAVERLRLEEQAVAITLRMQSDALQLQQVHAQMGSSVVPPAAEETMCVLCLDAPKDHIITPCGHQCVCSACAEKLKRVKRPACPICREPINATFKVFVA
jgi:hypothetical protein